MMLTTIVYICLLFVLYCVMHCETAPVSDSGVHILQLKSYRGSSFRPEADIHATGASKLITSGVKFINTNDLAEADLEPFADTFGPGSSKLKSDKDILWYTQIKIGTGEKLQEFDVDVDTGSSDLFIPGIQCKNNCEGHHRYDPHESSTSANTNKRFTLAFADKSSLEGAIYTDNVWLGGLVAKGQGFGVGDVYSEGLAKDNFSPDGLMGLGFNTLSHMDVPPLIDTLFEQKQIKKKMFGVRLDLARLNGDQGELTLGGYNEQHVGGEITFAPVNDDKYWQVKLDSVIIDQKPLAVEKNFIVDTGSTLINADEEFVKQLYGSIANATRVDNSKRWILPCDKIPILEFVIAGKPFPIAANSFTPGRVTEGSEFCYGGVVANVQPSEPWIVGGVFLSSVYTIFDAETKRVGFSVLKGKLEGDP